MERENMFMNETNNFLLPYSMAMQNEQHGTSQQLQDCFLNPIWDNSVDQNDAFESALSSMVSSPVTSNANASGDNIVLKELIGRLGSINNSCEVSPHSYMNGKNSTNNSCYSTPLNSPPKLNLAMMDHQIRGNLGSLPFPGSHLNVHASLGPMETEPGFAERAARYSCFGNNGLNDINGHQRMNVEENKDVLSLQEEKSSLSDQIPGGKYVMNGKNDGNLRKRKSVPKGKGKNVPLTTSSEEANAAAEKNELSAKRSKTDDNENGKDGELKGDKNGSENGNNKENKSDQKPSEPLKDYIHVRARRGQATDAHSLAERVRREKISQRMKFLQDLVPGCNKVTGKAVMLDEIINYVQSLQRQVEFLSMKLATINPQMDVDIEALLSSKDMLQARGSLPSGPYSSDNSVSAFPFHFQCQQVPNEAEMPLLPRLMDATTGRSQSMQVPFGNYNEAATQASSVWGEDLQSVVFGQNEMHNFESLITTEAQMKAEQ
ncbi:hypothetical protein Leryth_006272 [Lithospermum erythrorhizon]|nr:hypothetical protein Leryth_006272 [Lithospermum erythrorhizon]